MGWGCSEEGSPHGFTTGPIGMDCVCPEVFYKSNLYIPILYLFLDYYMIEH